MQNRRTSETQMNYAVESVFIRSPKCTKTLKYYYKNKGIAGLPGIAGNPGAPGIPGVDGCNGTDGRKYTALFFLSIEENLMEIH